MTESRWVALCLAAGLVPLAGCVRRTIEITSTPSDALVWVNHAEVGRTPFSFEFTHDGVYDVRIYHEDCIPLATHASTEVPVWDLPGFDVVAELAPTSFERVVEWHFELEPPGSATVASHSLFESSIRTATREQKLFGRVAGKDKN